MALTTKDAKRTNPTGDDLDFNAEVEWIAAGICAVIGNKFGKAQTTLALRDVIATQLKAVSAVKWH
jgi:hypothetical protein